MKSESIILQKSFVWPGFPTPKKGSANIFPSCDIQKRNIVIRFTQNQVSNKRSNKIYLIFMDFWNTKKYIRISL